MLNNQRHGNAYLFASLPPKWNRMLARPPVNTTSIFQRGYFPSHKEVRRLLRLLKPLVRQDYSNVKMRDARKKLVAAIIDELLQYAGQIRNLAPEWVDKAKLNREEAFWLAPNKALYDSDWAEQRLNEDWPVQIRHRFAVWLNSELNTPNLEPEYLEWKHGEWQYDIEDEMRILVEESLS
jgi:CRISPR-associated protein Csy1